MHVTMCQYLRKMRQLRAEALGGDSGFEGNVAETTQVRALSDEYTGCREWRVGFVDGNLTSGTAEES